MKNLLLMFLILCVFSCNNTESKREKIYEITEFDKPISETLIPQKGGNYSVKKIEVKGFSDDTIIVSFGKGYYKHYLTKKIDTVFSADYYGDKKATFIFEPYKAKKGSLKLKFRI